MKIELVETGKRLTKRKSESQDIYHTRLIASQDGQYLVENAWIWHPANVIIVYNVEQALHNPEYLDGKKHEIPPRTFLGEPG